MLILFRMRIPNLRIIKTCFHMKSALIYFQIGVPEGSKVEKVVLKEALSSSECEEKVKSDPETFKLSCEEESPTW